jgi:hypothetical protein
MALHSHTEQQGGCCNVPKLATELAMCHARVHTTVAGAVRARAYTGSDVTTEKRVAGRVRIVPQSSYRPLSHSTVVVASDMKRDAVFSVCVLHIASI